MVAIQLLAWCGWYVFHQWQQFGLEYRAAVLLEQRYQAHVRAAHFGDTPEDWGNTPRLRPDYFPEYGVLYSPITCVFLRDCNIDAHVWKLLSDLRFLEFVVIQDCRTRVPGGLDFRRFSRLEYLYISNTPMTLPEIRRLAQAPKLKDLCLYDCGATDEWLIALARCSGLVSLWISGDITDEGVRHISALERLRSLGLPKTRISPAACKVIATLSHLETLDLKDTAIDDEGIKFLRGLTSLRELNVSGTAISDRGVQYLPCFPKLTAVYLDSTRITKASLPILGSMGSLNPDWVTMEGTLIDEDEETRWRETQRRRRQGNDKPQGE